MRKRDVWRWVERAISIAAILGILMGWSRDRAVWNTKLDTLIKNDEKREAYWNNQNTINGGILEYMRNNRSSTGSTEEGPEGN